jgi:hypothetical protein
MDLVRLNRASLASLKPQAYEMSHLHRLDVARLMARLKPDWWDVREALQQLTENTGWYLMGPDGQARGWLIARQQEAFRTVEIQSIGYDNAGHFEIGTELEPLLSTCEEWGLYSGMANSRYIMSSRGLSIHSQPILDPALALAGLKNLGRPDFDWFLSMGYRPYGILPQIFGYLYHGIVLIKELSFEPRCPAPAAVL